MTAKYEKDRAMAGLSRFLLISRIALLAGLMLTARPAIACDACVPAGLDETQQGITIQNVVKAAADEIGSIGDDFTQFFGMTTGTIPGGGGINCTTLSSCMQMYFSELGGTNTNNQLMQSSVNAKGYDYLATQQYSQGLQQTKTNLALQNATGQTLQYQNNNLCAQATISTGMSAISAGVSNNVASYGAAGRIQGVTQNTAETDSGGVPIATIPNEYDPKKSASQRVIDLFNPIKTNFYGVGDPSTGSSPHWDTDVFAEDSKTDFTTQDVTAYDQYMNYIMGTPPEDPSTDTTFRGTGQGMQAVVAQHEKLAFYNLTYLAFKLDKDTRTPLANGAGSTVAKNVIAMFTAAGEPAPTGAISKADLMKAVYAELAENPSTIGNINGMAEVPTLQYIAGLMVFSNYIRYQRYLTEERDYRVNSAMLALQSRNANFATNP